jgi:hypothetical protein
LQQVARGDLVVRQIVRVLHFRQRNSVKTQNKSFGHFPQIFSLCLLQERQRKVHQREQEDKNNNLLLHKLARTLQSQHFAVGERDAKRTMIGPFIKAIRTKQT